MRRIAIMLALVVSGAAAPPAQQTDVPCRVCSSHGCQPCSKHGKELERERPANGTLFCSVAAACKHCDGALATDCKTCSNGPVEAEIERRRQQVAEWMASRRAAVDVVTDNKPLLHIETPHAELVFSIGATTVGRKKLDPHDLMHLYAERLESLRALFISTFELADQDVPGRLRIYMFRDNQDHLKISPLVTGVGGSGSTGTKLMGEPCVYSMWQDKRSSPDDEALHRQIVHNVAHLLLSNMLPSKWLGNRKLGWIDEGVAHWFEDKLTGKCTNFCFEELALQPGAGFKGGEWRVPVRKLVDTDGVLPFAELSQRNTDQLTFEEHAIAFAYVDFLLTEHGGAKFRDLVRLAKADLPMREALQKVYGLSPLTIDDVFKQWVKEHYSLR